MMELNAVAPAASRLNEAIRDSLMSKGDRMVLLAFDFLIFVKDSVYD